MTYMLAVQIPRTLAARAGDEQECGHEEEEEEDAGENNG